MENFVAVDMGASTGRLMLGKLDWSDNRLTLEEVYRFRTEGTRLFGGLYWDVLRFYDEIREGLRRCAQSYEAKIASLGVDSWGVDYAPLNARDELVSNPRHYRDPRTEGIMEEVFKLVPKEEIFSYTGIQFMRINTIFQLYAMSKTPVASITDKILMMADFFNYLLSRKPVSEMTLASTTQIYDVFKHDWCWPLIEKLGYNPAWFQRVVPPGTVLGGLTDQLKSELGLRETLVISPPCHDTAAAVAAAPAGDKKFLFISSGTWSLMGAELGEPLVNEDVLRVGFANEVGVENSIRFLKNITGFWILQECVRHWKSKGVNVVYEDLVREALDYPAFKYFINPDDPLFINPEDMPEAIQNFCKRIGQKPPSKRGEMVRCIFESLALRHKEVYEELKGLLECPLEEVYIIGGGSQNEVFCQYIADALNLPVYAGPAEATAIGNILTQACAIHGKVSLSTIRRIIRSSFKPKRYRPENTSEWEEAFKRYRELL
ncbi:MAG: rhamnulokinase [Candidatus Jordarchaeum sp.]|uniref:rhamnulokinase n=1 Tax=Candidatus Jordarchaeum sp. TaxID=2823881 RepID=UPI00404A1519